MQMPPRLTGVVAVALRPLLCPAENVQMQPEIQHLIDFAARSGCVFVRNASEHTPAETVNRIWRKYEHYRESIDSAETVIDLGAATTPLSGRPCWIRCGSDPPVQSRIRLPQELARSRQQRDGRQP